MQEARRAVQTGKRHAVTLGPVPRGGGGGGGTTAHGEPRQSSTGWPASEGARAGWLGRAVRALAVWLGCAVACADGGPVLPPFGQWDVEVGVPFHQRLTAVGGAQGPWRWRTVRGPVGLQVAGTTTTADVWWSATAFDLAPAKPGGARAPGPAQEVEIEATDSQGALAVSRGSLRAVPTPWP